MFVSATSVFTSLRRTLRRLLLQRLVLPLLAITPVGLAFPLTSRPAALPSGILRSLRNARVTSAQGGFTLTGEDPARPVELLFAPAQVIALEHEGDQWWVLPMGALPSGEHVQGAPPVRSPGLPSPQTVQANAAAWILPLDPGSADGAWHLVLRDAGTLSATQQVDGLHVTFAPSSHLSLTLAEARPHSDPFGNRFSFELVDGAPLADAFAAFYWGTMLPSVVEKTMAAKFRYSSGYVLSTLQTSAYAGSYPAVDHEFQIKGRLAVGSALDRDIARRMIELQFRLMHDDPEQLSRAPTSVQPDGSREYHIRRSSQDGKENAGMFPVTGTIEVVEESWRYFLASQDRTWLRAHIADLESAAAWTTASIDPYGRLWSDVYYEDQVIKDGRVTQAQCFAAYTFGLLGQMEALLGRSPEATHFHALSARLAQALIQPLPMGFWDQDHRRFVDWVDRNATVHDHLHLLANTLPLTFGYATPAQAAAVRQLLRENDAAYERFPSFLSPRVEEYSPSEIGSGGPYDLSAAGRYWFWDAAFRASEADNALLRRQLEAVAAEGAANGYFMGERYDMDHVFYIDGKHAHGAEMYYEYPVVYAAVLLSRYLGLGFSPGADVAVAPHLDGFGSVEFTQPQYALRYRYDSSGFTLTNLSGRPRRFDVDLSALPLASSALEVRNGASRRAASAHSTLLLPAHGEAHWSPRP